jgi:hypothetical protein
MAWYRRWWALLILMIVFITLFTLPYTIPLISSTRYLPGEILGFYGNIIGAIATLAAFFLMIQFTLNNQKNERKKAIKPHLQTEAFPVWRTYNADTKSENAPFFVQYLSDNAVIESSYSCPYFIEKEILGNKFKSVFEALSISREYLLIKYTITNVGGNSAVSIHLWLNKLPALGNFSIPVGTSRALFIIFGKELLENNRRKIEILLTYSDVSALTQYEQKESIWLEADDGGMIGYSQCGDEYLSEPLEITERKERL